MVHSKDWTCAVELFCFISLVLLPASLSSPVDWVAGAGVSRRRRIIVSAVISRDFLAIARDRFRTQPTLVYMDQSRQASVC